MDTATQSKVKFGVEKQEHLVKLAILTIAAILCEFKIIIFLHSKIEIFNSLVSNWMAQIAATPISFD